MKYSLFFLLLPFSVFSQVRYKVYVDSITVNSLDTPLMHKDFEVRFLFHNSSRYNHRETPTYLLSSVPSTVVFSAPFKLVFSSDMVLQLVNPLSFGKFQDIVTFPALHNSLSDSSKINFVYNNNFVVLHYRRRDK